MCPKEPVAGGYGHTRYDTLDKVPLRGLQDAAVLSSLLAVRWGSIPAEDWPVSRRSEEVVKAVLDQPENVETTALAAQVSDYYAEHAGK